MDHLTLAHCLDGAVRAAHLAGVGLAGYFGKLSHIHVSSKSSPVDLVSIADRESEEVLREELHRVLPGAGFIGEESPGAEVVSDCGLVWVVDPLDGTSNYLSCLPVWSISIALCSLDLTPLVGIVHAPPLDKTWTAIRGDGAYVNGELMHVRTEPPGGGLDNAMLATGFPYDVSLGRSVSTIAYYSKMQSRFQKIRRLGSAAIDMAYVAEGIFDGMWESRLREWDTAAGLLLVTESGGLCEQLCGKPYVPGAADMLAAATPQLLAMMRSVLASEHDIPAC
jgi:myo-inositol-1(or 4)-monophosphatase